MRDYASLDSSSWKGLSAGGVAALSMKAEGLSSGHTNTRSCRRACTHLATLAARGLKWHGNKEGCCWTIHGPDFTLANQQMSTERLPQWTAGCVRPVLARAQHALGAT